MGNNCCSQTSDFNNNYESLAFDIFDETILQHYSFYQAKYFIEMIEKDLNSKQPLEREKYFKTKCLESILKEEKNDLDSITLDVILSYDNIFLSKRENINIFKENKEKGKFLILLLPFINDTCKPQIILDICLLIKFKLSVKSFKEFLSYYLIENLLLLNERLFDLCNKKINSNLFSYSIDNDLLINALNITDQYSKYIDDFITFNYNKFLFEAQSILNLEEDNDFLNSHVTIELLELYTSKNTFLWSMKELRNNFNEFILLKNQASKEKAIQVQVE